MRLFFYTIFVLPVILLSQEGKKADAWEPMKIFVGIWEGTSVGEPGEGTVERHYRFVLNGKYLEIRNKSIYKPQEKNPNGEVHEDWGLFSYDRTRKKFVLRQFNVEGFVNQYVLDSLSSDNKTFVFVTEGIENIPFGWQAKETYRIINESEMIETFELAAPGKEFELYSKSHLRKKR